MKDVIERLKEKGVTLTPQRMVLPDGCPIVSKGKMQKDVKLRKPRHTFMEYAPSV